MKICDSCGAERRSLHRHHVIPRHKGGSDDDSNIQNLCSNCHEDIHNGSGFEEIRSNPELEQKRREGYRRYLQTDKGRAHLDKMIKASTEVFKDPVRLAERNKKISEGWTPEAREKKSQQMRELRAQRKWNTRTEGSLAALDEHRATAIANSVATRRRERIRTCISCGEERKIHAYNMCNACYMARFREDKKEPERDFQSSLSQAEINGLLKMMGF